MPSEPKAKSKNAAEFYAEQDDVFGRIAHRYDLLCDLFSLGLHRLWKRRVARVIACASWLRMLDCATGTGDIILRVVRQRGLSSEQVIIASDISPQMLAIAQKRLSHSTAAIEFQILDAQSLPSMAASTIDLYSISLGLKICEREQVLREAIRVLRPGGRLIVLEASHIVWPWLHQLYLRYMKFCLPIMGWAVTRGDISAYKYLLSGIDKFPTAEAFADELTLIGFEHISFERLTLGIVAIHVARKPIH